MKRRLGIRRKEKEVDAQQVVLLCLLQLQMARIMPVPVHCCNTEINTIKLLNNNNSQSPKVDDLELELVEVVISSE